MYSGKDEGRTYVDPVVPNRDYSERVPDGADGEIADEEEEVAIVVLAQAIVDPGAVMVHPKDAPVAHLAVRGASRLDLLAFIAALLPNLFQLCRRLVSVLHHRLYLT